MYSHVSICGRLTNDLELRESVNKNHYVRFTVAVNSVYSKNSAPVFIEAVAWRNNAINMHKFLKKGSLILLDGRLQAQANGMLEVSVNNVYFLEPKKTETFTKIVNTPTTVVENSSNSETITPPIKSTEPESKAPAPQMEKVKTNNNNAAVDEEEGIDWDSI